MKEDLFHTLNSKLEIAIEKGKNFLEDDDVQTRLKEAREKAELEIRKHPIKSVLAGFAVGFILAKIFSSED